jgi:hypothetical protein
MAAAKGSISKDDSTEFDIRFESYRIPIIARGSPELNSIDREVE